MDLAQGHSTGADEVKCFHCNFKFIERDALYMIHICGKFYPVCPKCGLSKFGSKKK